MHILCESQRPSNCLRSPPLNCRAVFTACISIHNTALWIQGVMPIEKQSFSQQSSATAMLIECKGISICWCMALYHETRDNWLCNTTWQYAVNSMIAPDYYCLLVSHGQAHVFVLFVRKQNVKTVTAAPLLTVIVVSISIFIFFQKHKHTVQ